MARILASSTSAPSTFLGRQFISRRSLGGFTIFFILLLIPPLAQAAGQPFYIHLFTRIMVFGIAVIGLDLILGYGGMVSLGHAAFIGIGAYIVGILSYQADNHALLFGLIPGSYNAFLVWPLAVGLCAIVSACIGVISLRTRGIYFIMITIAFGEMFYYLFFSSQTYGSTDGLQISQPSWPVDHLSSIGFYYLVYISLALITILLLRLVESRFGMVLRGNKQNERRMQSIGYPLFRYKLVALTIAGAITGYAGVLLANEETFVAPTYMSFASSAELLIMLALGGTGTIFGGIVGSAFYILVQFYLGNWTIHWPVIFGPFFVAMVLLVRRGAFSLLFGEDAGE